jgi:hypothetical protein
MKIVAVPTPAKSESKERNGEKEKKKTKPIELNPDTVKMYHVKKDLKKSNTDLMVFDNPESSKTLLGTLFPVEAKAGLSSSDIQSLIAALVFMRCATYFPFDREKVFFSTAKLKERLLEGCHSERTFSKLEKQSPLKQSKHPEVEGIEVSRNSSARFLYLDFLQNGDLTEKNSKKIKITSKTCKLIEIEYNDFPITIKKTLKDDFRTLIILPYHNTVEEYSKTIQAVVSKEEWYNILIATPKDDWLSFILCPKDDLLGSYCQIFIHESAESEIVDPKSRMDSGLAPFLLSNPTNSLFIWLDPFQMKIFKDPNPHQVVKGPASTGKTILVQLKVLQILRSDPLACKMLILLPFERLVDKFKLFFQNAGVETDGHNLLISTPNDPQLDEFIRIKNPHLFIDEYSAVIARKAQFSATLNNYLKNIPQSNYM